MSRQKIEVEISNSSLLWLVQSLTAIEVVDSAAKPRGQIEGAHETRNPQDRDMMPSHQYERVPLTSPSLEHLDHDSSYNSGVPNSPPPSFRSSASTTSSQTTNPSSYSHLPHRNDETAATYIPQSRRTTVSSRDSQASTEVEGDDGISLWGGTSSGASIMTRDAANGARDTLIVQLMARVAHLESRLDAQESTKNESGETDIESQQLAQPRHRWTYDDRWNAVATAAGGFLFVICFWTFLVLLVRARHSGTTSTENPTFHTWNS